MAVVYQDLKVYEKIKRLGFIDWNFSNATTNYLTHGIHPYPAKFIPQIPNALIRELSSEGETVVDIFCGSGTTLVEGLLLKRNVIGLDANPLACLISSSKTAQVSNEEKGILAPIVEQAESMSNFLSRNIVGSSNNVPFISAAQRPEHKSITSWFEPFIVEELAEILLWCKSLPSEKVRQIAYTAFSSIIVTVSKQDSDTRYVRRDKKLSSGDAFRRFAKALSNILNSIAEFSQLVSPEYTRKIINANILTEPDIGVVDLIVCSPPYPNAYSYHLYHMTRMVWLEMDNLKFKREEIGSHRKYSSKSRNGATTETFKNEMGIIFKWLYNHLRDGKYACFVVGNSTIKGEKVNNSELLSEVAHSNGFIEEACISRRMCATKKAFNPSIGKIKDEQILIFRKHGGIY